MSFYIKPQAQKDLRIVLEYIARDNRPAAMRVKDACASTFLLLGENPLVGTIVEDTDISDVRYFTVHKYRQFTVFYQVKGDDIEIIRVGYGSRDWFSLLL